MKQLDLIYNYLKDKMIRKKISKIGLISYCESLDKYAGLPMMKVEDVNNEIYKLLLSNQPCMIARFGAVELYCSSMFEFEVYSKKDNSMAELHRCAGFFPNDIVYGKKFSQCIIDSCYQMDILGIWALRFEEYYIKHFCQSTIKLTFLYDLEPWKCPQNPWTRILKGRKVLIIHPFEETILKQYKKRELIFPGTDILPEFELKTLKAVQTMANQKDNRFRTWFDALDYMYKEAMNIDFDVAIIGCGAYGMPLAAKLKESGKQAIHLGGVTQILFGIKGRRWDADPNYSYIRELYNDSWVYPSGDEKPENANTVENGCYW